MTSKTKKILVWVAAGLIIAGAAIGIIVDVCPTTDPEVLTDTAVVEVVDTVAPVVLDTVAVDTVVAVVAE